MDSRTLLVDRAVKVFPSDLDLDVPLVHALATADRASVFVLFFYQAQKRIDHSWSSNDRPTCCTLP